MTLPLAGFFQQGYITNDLDQALKFYHDRLDVKKFFTFDTTPYAASHPNMVALAWAGGVQIELIQPIADPSPLYADHCPADGFGIRFHHFGYMAEDPASWRAAIDRCLAGGLAMAHIVDGNEFVNFAYLDARPELGHFVELVLTYPAGKAFLEQIPHN